MCPLPLVCALGRSASSQSNQRLCPLLRRDFQRWLHWRVTDAEILGALRSSSRPALTLVKRQRGDTEATSRGRSSGGPRGAGAEATSQQTCAVAKKQDPRSTGSYGKTKSQDPRSIGSYGKMKFQDPRSTRSHGKTNHQGPRSIGSYGKMKFQDPRSTRSHGKTNHQGPRSTGYHAKTKVQDPESTGYPGKSKP